MRMPCSYSHVLAHSFHRLMHESTVCVFAVLQEATFFISASRNGEPGTQENDAHRGAKSSGSCTTARVDDPGPLSRSRHATHERMVP